jgi:hypothetical protein
MLFFEVFCFFVFRFFVFSRFAFFLTFFVVIQLGIVLHAKSCGVLGAFMRGISGEVSTACGATGFNFGRFLGA